MKIAELCNDEKPREKLISKGAGALSNAELIAILLGSGNSEVNAIDLGRLLLVENGESLSRVSNLDINALMKTKGIGPCKAASIAAAFELGRRFISEKTSQNEQIRGPRKVYEMMIPVFKGLTCEQNWIIYLNKSNMVLGKEMLTSGGIDATVFDQRVIIRKVLEIKATGIILLHNHPSGNPTPSASDVTATKRLKSALGTFDIALLDHIIVTDDSFYSFADEMTYENL